MKLKDYLNEEKKEDNKFIGIIPINASLVPYIKKVGKRGIQTKTFDKFNPEKKYELGSKTYNYGLTKVNMPQKTYLKIFLDKKTGGLYGKYIIKDYDSIEKMEVLTDNGWKKIDLPEKDMKKLSPQAEANLKIKASKKYFKNRKP